MITETEMLDLLCSEFEFPPLSIRVRRPLSSESDQGLTAILEARFGEQVFEFSAELRARSTPRVIEESLNRIQKTATAMEGDSYYPMLVVPYLRETQLNELQKRQVSGIDLSGNGVICIPGKILVYRTGNRNRFPDSAPTKYAYRGTTSLVARTFLCRRQFDSLTDIQQEIQSRGGSIAVSTISKALKRLESDLMIDRKGETICLRQPENLLEQLSESYREPKVTGTLTCSTKESLPKLVSAARECGLPMLTGRSSIDAYAVMGRDEWSVLYTPHIDQLREVWNERIEATSRFIDLELRQTNDSTVYFDARMKDDLLYASPVQVFLECSTGDKREQEVAMQVKDMILQQLNE